MNVGRLSFCRAAALLLIVAAGGRSHASETDARSQDLTRTARDLSDQGLAQYQRGDFDAAIESFMGAFALSNNPGLIFNVAQAYRLKGDCARAKEHYRRYLDLVPGSALKSSVDRRLDEMESCLQTSAAANPPGKKAASTTTSAAVPAIAVRAVAPAPGLPPSPPPPGSQQRRAITWTLRGSAVALVASSAAFGVLAWDARGDAEDASLQRPAVEANDRYRLDSALAWTFAISGLACGVISYVVGRRP